jgi:hypothetical protein
MIIAQPPRLARHAIILVYAILLTGIVAAYQAAPALWFITPIVAWIVLRAAVRDARRPAIGGIDIRELPDGLRAHVRSTFAQLPDGDARRLLLGVVNQARLLFARSDSRFEASEDEHLREHVAGLVDACCGTAADLARIDQFANAATDGGSVRPDLATRVAKARELFRDRLTSAATALVELYTANLEKGTPSTDRVAELTAAIGEDMAARTAAVEEMRKLLDG